MAQKEDLEREQELGERAEVGQGKARWLPPRLQKHGTVAEITALVDSPIAGVTVTNVQVVT